MANVYSADSLIESFTSDFTWRVREISDFKASVKGAAEHLRTALLRGGVPLVYAHWEGHVAFVTKQYTDYVKAKRIVYADLRASFILHALSKKFDQLYGKRLSLIEKLDFLAHANQSRAERFSLVDGDVFKTRSNLNSSVLQDLCTAINLDIAQFSGDFDFIDKRLVGKRNNIAHGRDTRVDLEEFEVLVERTIGLMRLYRNLVENQVALEGYRMVPPPAPAAPLPV